MTDMIEYIPKRHGQKPDYWTPDTLTGLDGKNYVRQPNWAWIAGTTYYVPYEAVHGVPRLAPVDADADAGPDLIDTIEAQAAEIERLNALIADTAEHWMALQFKHPIQWEGAIDSAMAAACAEIEALQADNARLREALRVYAGPMEWSQEPYWGAFPVWADGYPGGVYIDDNTLDFGEAARTALQETER